MILTAAYVLWTLQRVVLGKPAGASSDDHGHGHAGHGHVDHGHADSHGSYPDLTTRETIIAIPLVFLTVALGLLPTPFLLAWMSPSVDETVKAILGAKTMVSQTAENQSPVLIQKSIETAGR